MKGALADRVSAWLVTVAEANGWQIHELNVQINHVHLLIQYRPDESIAEVAQKLKGVTSLNVCREFPALASSIARRGFWGKGYFAASVGSVAESVVRRYIREQPWHAVAGG